MRDKHIDNPRTLQRGLLGTLLLLLSDSGLNLGNMPLRLDVKVRVIIVSAMSVCVCLSVGKSDYSGLSAQCCAVPIKELHLIFVSSCSGSSWPALIGSNALTCTQRNRGC